MIKKRYNQLGYHTNKSFSKYFGLSEGYTCRLLNGSSPIRKKVGKLLFDKLEKSEELSFLLDENLCDRQSKYLCVDESSEEKSWQQLYSSYSSQLYQVFKQVPNSIKVEIFDGLEKLANEHKEEKENKKE